ncbi:hypothetical protein TraAM80_08073 [Trypanosoma rangeli]|uniref:Uncharacterized protein n=1 Tax=Trypanosoma rangeli TaxID=5698 RepID=A0A422N2C3_TRYRA|nr:uncharacterized protein TraAM80_08073 [Trypanosoma rangeli]RNE99605.1 hypothetical protein TraAM80_08073 [Trypanosoma rangeli]|eukprot:RNE99605.1 hypothetical protein TraAM80_08073 [Trypanosoma rangeli]
MHGDAAGGAAGTSTGTVDMLAEERSSLQLILGTVHATLDYHCRAARNPGNSSNSHGSFCSSSGGRSDIASEAEVVELLGMLPKILCSAVDPATLQVKERQRQYMTVAGVARPPPLSWHTTLYRLLFTPLLFSSSSPSSLSSSSSSKCGGDCAVLECLARVLMSGGDASRMEPLDVLPGDPPEEFATATRQNMWFAGTVTLAALRSLGDIVQLCLHDAAEERRVGGKLSTALPYNRTTSPSGEKAVATQNVLRDALGHALCQTGLFCHLWHTLLFQPVVHTQRVVTARVLCDVSRAGLLQLSAAIARMRHMMDPAVWGRRVAECILSDPNASVRESLAAALYAGLQSSLLDSDLHAGHSDGCVYWWRWLTSPSLRCLLGVVATGDSFAVLQPVLGSLILVLEHEQWKDATRQCPPTRSATERVDAVSVAEVCATVLVHLFTGPTAVNARSWDDDCGEQLRRYRLLVRGSVRLLRLALRSVDRLLGGAGVMQQPNGGDDAERKASVLLTTCVEKQLLFAVMACLETPPEGSCARTFVTSSMRAEMVRLVRDVLERASSPLFFLTCKLVAYLPTMLQVILDATKHIVIVDSSRGGCNDNDDSDGLPPCRSHEDVLCSAGVETISLLGVMLWYAPLVRECFLDVLASLHCTAEQQEVLFDAMEALAQSMPSQAVQDLLIVDVTGTIMNEVNQQHREGHPPQLDALERLLVRQEQQQRRRRQRGMENRGWVAGHFTPECRWVSVQQQRQKLGPQHGHVCRVFVWFILHHLRNSSRKLLAADGAEEEGAAGSVSVSPIQSSTGNSMVGHHVGRFINDLQKSSRREGDFILLGPRYTPAVERQELQYAGEEKGEEAEEGIASHNGVSDTLWLQRVSDGHSVDISRQQPPQAMEEPGRMSPAVVGRNPMDPLERVRQRQLQSIAAEETAYRAALSLFASLASRYYRHFLTPRVALEYLHRLQHGGAPRRQRITSPTFTHFSGRRSVNNSNNALRLWTDRDARREDFFYFSLLCSEITEQAIAELVERCKRHRQALHRTLRTVPQASRGRRWFLQDAATNIMDRLIALFQILLQHIHSEGEQAVQQALAQMPPPSEHEDGDGDFMTNVTRRCDFSDDTLWRLHGGTLIEVTEFLGRCFSRPAKQGNENATTFS